MRPELRNNRARHKADTEGKRQNDEEPATHHTEGNAKDFQENYLLNKDLVPYATSKFFGCDITMDNYQIVTEAQSA